ncbi:RNA polymerase sigma factor RpoE [Minicystis rosea]|nr:RNA polymerase sigma factor RpoE [Minicystis rosea]
MSPRLRLIRAPALRRTAPDRDPAAGQVLRDLHARKPAAERWLLESQGRRVEGILVRVLGDYRNLEDHVQEVFARVFARIDAVQEPEALTAFITSVTVFVAREAIRKKRRHGWLAFFASEELPEVATVDEGDAREGVRAFYRAVARLEPDERLAFTLRIVEGMELTEVAAACEVSLATVKRRIQRAEAVFVEQCKKDEVLSSWLEEGDRWA